MATLFVDMDGTMARFYDQPDAVRRYRTDNGFFLSLGAYENLILALKSLMAEDVRVIILSAVDSDIRQRSILQKTEWLKMHFGRCPEAYFPPTGSSKAAYVKKNVTDLNGDCWLLDDYSKNLLEWTGAGGSAVKAVNGINSAGIKWQGPRLQLDSSPDDIILCLLEQMYHLSNGKSA